MIEHSESINELAGALAKAQAEMKGALKDSKNPHFNSQYAGLDSVWEACRPALTSHGLSVVQAPTAAGPAVSVTTTILHASGQWMRSTLTMTARDASPQAIGSCVTYARRYGLCAMAGIAPEDDDGNAAQGNGAPAKRGRPGQVTDEQRRASTENAPYADRERAKADGRPANVDADGVVTDPAPPPFTDKDWHALRERMKKWTPQAQKAIPSDQADFLFVDPDAEQNRQTYIDGIREAAERRKLTAKVQTDIKELFTGSRQSQLAHVPILILRALWIEMDPETRGEGAAA